MARESRTAIDLASIIEARIGGQVKVSVCADPLYGWRARVFSQPTSNPGCQERVNRIASQLREQFTLASETERPLFRNFSS